MNSSIKLLSDVISYTKYAKYLEKEKRRETWEETVARLEAMHVKKFPKLKEEIKQAFKLVYEKKILPSMRSLQFGGKPIELLPSRIFNCSYAPVETWEVFHEIMFLLLGGSGVGYSVQRHHVRKLPEIKGVTKRTKRYLIADSIQGWSNTIKILMRAYFLGESDPVFDYSDIRPKGTPLKTSGGKAPGPQPLKDCVHNIRKILDQKNPGDKLSTLEAHDILCYIADAVLSGGIRRAAMISFFSVDDEEMLSCKFGSWFELNPQRARANNSVVMLRHKIKKEKFQEIWKKIELSGSGEPGIFFTNDSNMLANPCGEVSLKPYGVCNLSTINGMTITNQEDFLARAKAAAFIGTLQASYTDFAYLRDVWKETAEKEALIGVSVTGIASKSFESLDCEAASKAVVEENKRVSKLIGIKPAARCTVVKPEGSSSLLLGTSSGIHSWYAKRYIRRVRLLKTEALYKYLIKHVPELVEDDYFKPEETACALFPIEAPKDAITREDETAIDLLERIKRMYSSWIVPGHNKGDNTNNVSATISIKPEEWSLVGEWMWKNRESYNCLSVLPYDTGSYVQAPHEECTKNTYDALIKHAIDLSLKDISEEEDTTQLQDELACAGGKCEII